MNPSLLRQSTLRATQASVKRMMRHRTWEGVSAQWLEEIQGICPGECLSWNEFTPRGGFELIGCTMSQDYMAILPVTGPRLPTFLPHHPILQKISWAELGVESMRLSDFQAAGAFRNRNPLFHEVYRHLDAHHQAVVRIGTYSDRDVKLALNRRHSDFTDDELVQLTYLAQALDPHLKTVDRHRSLEKDLRALHQAIGQRMEVPGHYLDQLTNAEIGALHCLVTGDRLALRDSHRRRALSSLREKLQLESNRQVLAAWRAVTDSGTGGSSAST